MDELQYVVAITYCELKSEWIRTNCFMNYSIESGSDPDMFIMSHATGLSLILQELEKVMNDQAINEITLTLGESVRNAAIGSSTGTNG